MAGNGSGWRLPIDQAHRLADDAGPLSFVGGAGDFGADGRIAHPGDFGAQLQGAMTNIARALGLRAGEIIAVPGRTAIDEQGRPLEPGEGIKQTDMVMAGIG